MEKCIHKFLLIGSAGGDRFAVDAIDNHVVGFHLRGLLTLENVENHLLVELVVPGAVRFKLLYFLFKLGRLVFVAHHSDQRATRRYPQLGEEVAQELHIGVVHAIKAHGVGLVDNNNPFYHRFICKVTQFLRNSSNKLPL